MHLIASLLERIASALNLPPSELYVAPGQDEAWLRAQGYIDARLVGGFGFAVHASPIRADANKQLSADAAEGVD